MNFALRIALGFVFAILGVVGIFLPILPGWAFFILSGLVLFPRSRFAVKALEKIDPRMPRLVAWLRRAGIGVRDQGAGDQSAAVPAEVLVRRDGPSAPQG